MSDANGQQVANATSPSAAGGPDIQHTPWRIDPEDSSVEFNVRHLWGLATVKGSFEQYYGTLDLAADPAIVLTVEADTLNTKNARRDKHLRSADFFDTANHPQVRFVSQSATLDGERLQVQGTLHAAGESIPLELEGLIRPDGDDLAVDVTTLADHRTLGMTWNGLGMLRGPSKLIVRGRLVRDEN